MDLEAGTIIAGRYRIQRQLGRGGMGEVFSAENVRTGRVVAVKLLRADTKQKSSAVARFRREARAAGAISSDYVTQVLDVEDDPEHGIVLVFELLEGESLIDRLKRVGPMTFDELYPYVEQTWIGLSDAHKAGVIHRDLKPSNVFLEKRPDGTSRVKILDFGISKITREVGNDTLTEMGQNLGTFSFMPPEQIGKAKTVDHRADIYAVATLIYQAMSGQLPYAARNILMIVELKTKAEPRKLADVMDTPVDPRLEAFLSRALKRDPEDRFQSADEALEAWRALRSSNQQTGAAQDRSSGGYAIASPHSEMGQSQATGQQPGPRFAAPPTAQSQAGYETPRPNMAGTMAMQQPILPSGPPPKSQARTTAMVTPSSGGRSYSGINALPSVVEGSSDGGSDSIATIAIPLRRVNEALAQRGFAVPGGIHTPNPSSSSPLPRMHEDKPNLGTQVMTQGRMGPTSRSGTMAMAAQPTPAAYSHAGGYGSGQPQNMPPSGQVPSSQQPNNVGQGGVSQHPHQAPGSHLGPPQVVPVEAPQQDLQTSVYRRDNPQTANTSTSMPGKAGKKRSSGLLVFSMILLAVVGFVLVAVVVSLVRTGKLPFVG